MAALEIRYIASTFAATAGIRFEGTVPAAIFLNVAHHIFLLIVPAEAVLTKLFTKISHIYLKLTYVQAPTL
jgi:hypothetical protein